jgi:hypothetical protein
MAAYALCPPETGTSETDPNMHVFGYLTRACGDHFEAWRTFAA